MGGAADVPHRSSSPLKRRASDLEDNEPSSSQREDVDMITVSESDFPEVGVVSGKPSHTRAQSVDMLRNEAQQDSTDGQIKVTKSSKTSKSAETDPPDIDSQIATVTALCTANAERRLEDGDKIYLVSKRWLNRVISRGSDARKKSKVEPEGDIGPVDNSDIINQIIKDVDGNDFVQLRRGTGEDDFMLFPEEAWTMIVEWYGLMPGSIPIVRYAHQTNEDQAGQANVQYEFHPPVFKIHRLHSAVSGILIPQKLKATNPPAPIFVCSRSTKTVDFQRNIKKKAGVDMSNKIRIWRVIKLLPAGEPSAVIAGAATPPASRPSSPTANPSSMRQPHDSWTNLFLDVEEFVKLERDTGREVVETRDFSADLKYNGKSKLGMIGLNDDETIVIDESTTTGHVINTTSGGKGTSTAFTKTSNQSTSNNQSKSGRTSPAPSGPITRGRAQKAGRPVGVVGLSNLGNTCYMNSALQCIRSVEELTKYFLTGTAESEINAENPLGHNGDVAISYANLLKSVYVSPTPPSVTPRHFKTTIGRYAPSFSGYGQQDSQEFLGFLLDGLQEDLSRIKKKPYIEKPDSTDEMVNNPEAIREMAAKVWDITKKRDDSVVADLFTGMYKSTLVCPTCAKVSITFDPFNSMTLQLPIENTWTHQVVYYPLNNRPVIIDVDIDKQASISTLKAFVSKRVGVPVERLFAAEEWKSKFYKIYDDFSVASEEISSNDHVAIYELEAKPTNWPGQAQPKKKSGIFGYGNESGDDCPPWDDPVADTMVVPVIYRRPSEERNGGYRARKPWTFEGPPHFIIVTRSEARNLEMIKRKVLEKVATFTTWDEFSESESDSVDQDMVLTTGSDADSSGGTKVVATSVDGEDELVDVTMKESPPKPALFNGRRPKFLAPKSLLKPSLQNMFEIGYFEGNKEVVPAGWNEVTEEKTYPALSSRLPVSTQVFDDITLDGGYSSKSTRDGSESSEENLSMSHDTPLTRMNEESSDEDEIPVHKALPLRSVGPKSGGTVGFSKRAKRQMMKTYSKKGVKALRKVQNMNVLEQDVPDEGPLIRPGEGLVVDWNSDAWDALFGGTSDSMRGEPLWTSLPILEDPQLHVKRTHRKRRRQEGLTLDDCLNEFGKEEILSEVDTWYCPRCKEHVRASKKFEIWRTPDILIMHLKRFSSSGYRRDKLDVLVDFPIEGLDLSSRVIESEDGKEEIYDLIAVDDHWGGLGGGHYTAFAKNFYDNQWYEYNDSTATVLKNMDRIVTSSAYLLFYRRRSNAPLGGPRFEEISRIFDNMNRSDASEDEENESGEGQGLVGNSSLRGSSSALTGVGAAHHQQSHGSPGAGMTTINPSALEEGLPAYKERSEGNMLSGPAEMAGGLHPSIEDEGIGMDDGMNFNTVGMGSLNSAIGAKWSFDALPDSKESGQPSEINSDVVDNASSADARSLEDRMSEFRNAPAEDENGEFFDQSPVPEMDPAQIESHAGLFRDILTHKGNRSYSPQAADYEVDVQDEFIVEEPAAEIHITDDDDTLKME